MSANIKAAGAYQLVLMGKGCYQGTKTVDFTVTAAAIDTSNTNTSNTQTKQETTVTGVGDVIDGMQLVQNEYEGKSYIDGSTVKFTTKLVPIDINAENYNFIVADCDGQLFEGSDRYAAKDNKDLYTIHMASVEYENYAPTTFKMKIKMDDVKEETPVYGVFRTSTTNSKTFDDELEIVAHNGYIEITNANPGKVFHPSALYIAVEK